MAASQDKGSLGGQAFGPIGADMNTITRPMPGRNAAASVMGTPAAAPIGSGNTMSRRETKSKSVDSAASIFTGIIATGADDDSVMRYRLRTLVILTALGPPLLAGLWFVAPALPDVLVGFALLSGALLIGLVAFWLLIAAVLGVPLLIGWVFSLIANGLIRLLVSPENRR
jgi:hypothetical protein